MCCIGVSILDLSVGRGRIVYWKKIGLELTDNYSMSLVENISLYAGSFNLFAPQKLSKAVGLQADLHDAATVSFSAQAVETSRNMSAFAPAVQEKSKYLSALKNGIAAEQNMMLSMKHSEVVAVSEAIADMGVWHGGKSTQQAKLMKDLTKEDEKSLKDIRKHLKEKAQEAQNSSEQNGEKTTTADMNPKVASASDASTPEKPVSVLDTKVLDTPAMLDTPDMPEQETAVSTAKAPKPAAIKLAVDIIV